MAKMTTQTQFINQQKVLVPLAGPTSKYSGRGFTVRDFKGKNRILLSQSAAARGEFVQARSLTEPKGVSRGILTLGSWKRVGRFSLGFSIKEIKFWLNQK